MLIAVDPHKARHSVAVVDVSTGHLLGEHEFANSATGVAGLLRWSQTFGPDRVFAIEDVRNLTRHLERHLLLAGQSVIRVTPRLTALARTRDHVQSKSDRVDARSIARAVLERGVAAFPQASPDRASTDVRLLADYRGSLIRERTRTQNRLRDVLMSIDPRLEAEFRPRSLGRSRTLAAARTMIGEQVPSVRTAIANRECHRIEELNEAEHALRAELGRLIAHLCPALLEIPGCGVISAATLLGRVPNASAYPTDGHFARLAGVAPIVRGSGPTQRHRLDHGGNRQINAALHQIALAQKRWHPPAQAYLERKRTEGKSSRQALRCLKRQLARPVWQALKTAQDNPEAGLKPDSLNALAGRPPAAPGLAGFAEHLGPLVIARMSELRPLVDEYEQARTAVERIRYALGARVPRREPAQRNT